MSKTYTELFVHFVWGTFDRAPWLIDVVEKPLHAAMSQKCREMGCVPIAIGGTHDHVHLLAAIAPTIAVSTFVKEVKGTSAYIMTHGLNPHSAFRWQTGYGAFTLRKTDLPVVRNYIMRQKEHHSTHSIKLEWELPKDDTSSPREHA